MGRADVLARCAGEMCSLEATLNTGMSRAGMHIWAFRASYLELVSKCKLFSFSVQLRYSVVLFSCTVQLSRSVSLFSRFNRFLKHALLVSFTCFDCDKAVPLRLLRALDWNFRLTLSSNCNWLIGRTTIRCLLKKSSHQFRKSEDDFRLAFFQELP